MLSPKKKDLLYRALIFMFGISIVMWGIWGIKNRFELKMKAHETSATSTK